MATKAHCAYCFETLAANFESRRPLSLAQVEELWSQYHAENGEGEDEEDEDEDDEDEERDASDPDDPTDATSAKPAAISRLLNRDAATSSNSSLPSTKSTASSSSTTTTQSGTDSSGTGTPASVSSSRTSLFSLGRRRTATAAAADRHEEHPLFVTWNTVSPRSGSRTLRGCIGTFEPLDLETGLRSYSLTSALEDLRFTPIPATLLPSLSAHVTLLTNFTSPNKDPLAWTLGKNGLRISFSYRGRRYGSTYLPDVAKEQGWTKEETVVSLMRKSGWNGNSRDWEKTWKEGNGALVTYEGKQVGLLYAEWKSWRSWVEERGVVGKGVK